MLQRTPGRSTAWVEAAHCTSRPRSRPWRKALDNLLAHGVVEDMRRDDAVKLQVPDDTLGRKGWRMKNGEWKMKVRFVAQKCEWAEHREDLFSAGATHSPGRVIDFKSFEVGHGDVGGGSRPRVLSGSETQKRSVLNTHRAETVQY